MFGLSADDRPVNVPYATVACDSEVGELSAVEQPENAVRKVSTGMCSILTTSHPRGNRRAYTQ
jgi:hypothetical protein